MKNGLQSGRKEKGKFPRSYVALGVLDEDEDEFDVGKGKTMTEVEVTPIIVDENTVERGVLDESPPEVREDMVVGGADEVGGWMVELPLQLERLEFEGPGELVNEDDVLGSLELNEVEGSGVNVSIVVREEVCDVEIVWKEDGDCGGSNEDVTLSAEVETLDEVPRIVLELEETVSVVADSAKMEVGEDEDVLVSDADVAGIFKVSSDIRVNNQGKATQQVEEKGVVSSLLLEVAEV
jgi:hypothetical protein